MILVPLSCLPVQRPALHEEHLVIAGCLYLPALEGIYLVGPIPEYEIEFLQPSESLRQDRLLRVDGENCGQESLENVVPRTLATLSTRAL